MKFTNLAMTFAVLFCLLNGTAFAFGLVWLMIGSWGMLLPWGYSMFREGRQLASKQAKVLTQYNENTGA